MLNAKYINQFYEKELLKSYLWPFTVKYCLTLQYCVMSHAQHVVIYGYLSLVVVHGIVGLPSPSHPHLYLWDMLRDKKPSSNILVQNCAFLSVYAITYFAEENGTWLNIPLYCNRILKVIIKFFLFFRYVCAISQHILYA